MDTTGQREEQPCLTWSRAEVPVRTYCVKDKVWREDKIRRVGYAVQRAICRHRRSGRHGQFVRHHPPCLMLNVVKHVSINQVCICSSGRLCLPGYVFESQSDWAYIAKCRYFDNGFPSDGSQLASGIITDRSPLDRPAARFFSCTRYIVVV